MEKNEINSIAIGNDPKIGISIPSKRKSEFRTYIGGTLWQETSVRRRLVELLLYDRFSVFACSTVAAIDP